MFTHCNLPGRLSHRMLSNSILFEVAVPSEPALHSADRFLPNIAQDQKVSGQFGVFQGICAVVSMEQLGLEQG